MTKLALVAYVALMTGMAWGQVGSMSGPSEPFPWWSPFAILFFTGAPALIGYLAGREDGEAE